MVTIIARPEAMRFFVEGRPAPKGSKDVGAHGQVYDQSPYLKVWTDTVAYTCLSLHTPRFGPDTALQIDLEFYMKRAWRTPDGDKLTRAVWDGLVAGRLIPDDKYVVRWSGARFRDPNRYGLYGCQIAITALGEWR